MLIKDSIIEFFKQKMDVDITNVSITVMNLSDYGDIGQYNSAIPNTIAIDVDEIHATYRRASAVMLDVTVVHELTHLCQMQYNKSLILPINSIFSGKLLSKRYAHMPAYQDPTEIDALIMECYYLYCSKKYTHDSVCTFVEHTLSNVCNVNEYTQRLKDDGFNQLINSLKNNSNMKEC